MAKTCTRNTGGLDSIPGQGTRSHMPQLKIPSVTTKTNNSKINKHFRKKSSHLEQHGVIFQELQRKGTDPCEDLLCLVLSNTDILSHYDRYRHHSYRGGKAGKGKVLTTVKG